MVGIHDTLRVTTPPSIRAMSTIVSEAIDAWALNLVVDDFSMPGEGHEYNLG